MPATLELLRPLTAACAFHAKRQLRSGRPLSAGLRDERQPTLEDPAGLPLDDVRTTRDDIARRVNELVLELDHQVRHL